MRLICQTQEQQLQVYAHHMEAILNMAEDRAHMCEFMGWAGGDSVLAFLTPVAEVDHGPSPC